MPGKESLKMLEIGRLESSSRTPPHSLHSSSRRSTEVAEITQLSTQPQSTIVAHLTKTAEPLVTLVLLLVVSAACSQRPTKKHCKHPQKPKLNPGTPTKNTTFSPTLLPELWAVWMDVTTSPGSGLPKAPLLPWKHPRGKGGKTIATCQGTLEH